MRIEVVSVNATDGGAEMILTLELSDGEGHSEKRRLLLFTEQYFELGLSRGAIVSEEQLDEMERLSGVCVAMRKGNELLSYSPSSRRRLVSRLRSKGIDRESAEAAAARLEETGMIDERADVERAVRSYLKKLWGRRRIKQELIAKGYGSECVGAALEELDDEALVENCVKLVRKKYRELPQDPDEAKKMIAALARYGYTYGEIREALRALAEDGDL